MDFDEIFYWDGKTRQPHLSGDFNFGSYRTGVTHTLYEVQFELYPHSQKRPIVQAFVHDIICTSL